MKEIKLSGKHGLGKVALVDDEDYNFINQFKWYVTKRKYTHYAMNDRMKNGKRNVMIMHRIIMKTPAGLITDHRDQNGLNNQKSNLRICTKAENAWNRKPHPNSSSKYLGVSFSSRYKKWVAEININYTHIYLGRYKDEIQAAQAYNEAALKYHGEFARINNMNI